MNKNIMLFLTLVFLLIGQTHSQTSYTKQINDYMNMTYWLNDQTYITIQLECLTLGWCAIGFGQSMANADIICLSGSNNIVNLVDMLSQPTYQNIAPSIDEYQDIYTQNSGQIQNYIFAKFIRKLITDDTYDYPIKVMQETKMIWAINFNNQSICSTMHDEFGNFEINFGLNEYVCHYMCQGHCLGPLISDCQLCTIDTFESINGYCKVGNVDEVYASEEVSVDQLTVDWAYDSDENIQLVFYVSKCEWFGLAFGLNMFQTDMVLFTVQNFTNPITLQQNYVIDVQDMYGVGNMVPNYDRMYGGQNDWILLGYNYNNQSNIITAKAKRKLNTNDPKDFLFNKSNILVSYAFGNNTNSQLSYHGANRGVFQLDLSLNNTQNPLGKWGKFIYKGHTVLNFIFWGIISDIGIIFARQLKSYPKHLKVHGMIFLFQSIVTFCFTIAMISLHKNKIQNIYAQAPNIIAHFVIGIFIVVLLTFQLFFGMMVKSNLESLNGSEMIFRLKAVHQIFGYISYFLTKINVAIGVHMYAADWLFWFYFWYILLFLIKLTIELLYYFEISLFPRVRISYHLVETDKNFLYERLIDRLNSGVARYDLMKEFSKLRYIILREAVYDVTDFHHPGGQFIIEAIRGREIGRYFYGGSPVDKLDIVPHKHSQFAINYIETKYIGDFRNECCQILYHELSEDINKQDLMVWKFIEQHKISEQTRIFYFQSNHFMVKQQIKGVRWFGRYFYIKPFGGYQLQERPYSVIICMSDENMHLRQQIINYFKAKIIEQNVNPEKPDFSNFKFSKVLNFIIKRQEYSNNMSRFLHETFYKPYEITGPYGLGLELNETSNGTHYVICNGTGVLPFLDLFDFLLKKAFYTIINDKYGIEMAEIINPNQEDYLNTFGNRFKVVLVGAFKNREEFYGCAIIDDLYTICKSFNLPIFDMVLYMTESNMDCEHKEVFIKKRFDENTLQSIIKDAQKVYICGSNSFEQQIMTALKILKIQKRQIVTV